MRRLSRVFILAVLSVVAASTEAAASSRFQLEVVVEGHRRPEYRSGSSVYVEAIAGQEFVLRMTNPTPYRMAVALSVDGLNTIDARHTTPRSASKWVLEPYGSAEISGWQVDSGHARRFFFTSEERSYGAKLGQTENLGVIEAVVYRERRPRIQPYSGSKRERRESLSDAAAAPSEKSESEGRQSQAVAPETAEEYAATGMGHRTRHDVELVDIDLEPEPVSTVRIRYEFRPQLVELGILPVVVSPLERRERARGFDRFCPE